MLVIQSRGGLWRVRPVRPDSMAGAGALLCGGRTGAFGAFSLSDDSLDSI